MSVFLNCLLAFEFKDELETNSFLTEPSFNYFDSNQKITLTGETAFSQNGSEYLIKKPKLKIKTDTYSSNIKALEAKLNKSSKLINFRNSVTFYTKVREEILIESEQLSFNLDNQKLKSKVEVFTTYRDLNINSLGLDVVQDKDGIKAEFNKGEIKIKDDEIYHTGYANKITIFSELNELIMEGEAYIDQDGFKIKSEKIHYDLEENKIMKSINSTIERSR
tara:strand:- start:121 stop:783 length:663 start_codon:yes stop_codon:yes gene_type:complete